MHSGITPLDRDAETRNLRILAALLLARLMGQHCFACRRLSSVVVVCRRRLSSLSVVCRRL